MVKFLLASFVVAASARAGEVPGAYVSLAGSALKRGINDLVPKLVDTIKGTTIPGQNGTLYWFEDISVDALNIGSYDVDVLPDDGVQVTLKDMSNQLSHTRFHVHDLLNLVQCTGTIWGSATGASYVGHNTLEVADSGKGEIVLKGDLDAGDVELHHKMESANCERLANVFHVVNAVIIKLVTNAIEDQLNGILTTLVLRPINVALGLWEYPPALGFGGEKFQLDNSFTSVDYSNERVTHYQKGAFSSTKNPQKTQLTPPELVPIGKRDLEIAFSDYTLNTLLESQFAEHIGEHAIIIPFVKTMFDKACSGCPIVVKNTFGARGVQKFDGGAASVRFQSLKWEIGGLQKPNTIMPLVDLSVNVTLAQSFSLTPTAQSVELKADMSLQELEQEVIVSHIGKINMDDLTRDIKLLVTATLGDLNRDVPPLPIPVVPGVKLTNAQITNDKQMLIVETDLVAADFESIVV